jgi:isopenicillin N synthase-like dioxygenase
MAAQGSTLDMSHFFGTEEQKQNFCHELLRLLKRYGCVKITNHSIPDEDIHNLFDIVGDTAFALHCHQTDD